jgi:hypothetical protein
MVISMFRSGLFADVMFELDDGSVPAHKAILTARCDVMKAMFSGDFRESSAKVVSVFCLVRFSILTHKKRSLM